MKYLLMVVLLFSFNQARAASVFASGSDLLGQCEANLSETKSDINIATGMLCSGYVQGISDAHESFVSAGVLEGVFCIRRGVNVGQLVRIVTKHLQEHPEKLHMGASGSVLSALRAAFPCE